MKPPQQIASDPEVRVSLGLPGLSAEVPVRLSWVQRLWRWMGPDDVKARIRVVAARVTINVPEDDSGRFDCALTLVNFSRKTATVRSVHIEWISLGNNGVSEVGAQLARASFVCPALSHIEITFSARLDADDIRRVQRGMSEPNSKYSSPRLSIDLRAALGAEVGGEMFDVPASISGIVPFLNLYNPSSRHSA